MFTSMASLASPAVSLASLPPICEYLDRYSHSDPLYMRQRTLLKCIYMDVDKFTDYDRMVVDGWIESSRNHGEIEFPVDFYKRVAWCRERGYTHFTHVIVAGGRRMGKGVIGGRIAEYQTAQLIARGNPQAYYGIDESKTLEMRFFASSKGQARSALYMDAMNAILMDDYLIQWVMHSSGDEMVLQTPHDRVREREIMERARSSKSKGRGNFISIKSLSSISIAPMSLKGSTARGGAGFMQGFDEFAHVQNTDSDVSADATYEAATPSLAQMGKDALMYMPSSPWAKENKFYKLFESAMGYDSSGTDVPRHKAPLVGAVQGRAVRPVQGRSHHRLAGRPHVPRQGPRHEDARAHQPRPLLRRVQGELAEHGERLPRRARDREGFPTVPGERA